MSRTGEPDTSLLIGAASFTSFAEEPTVGAIVVRALGLNFDETGVHRGRNHSDCSDNATEWGDNWENNCSSSGGSNGNASQYSTWQIVALATLAGATSVLTIGGNFIVILSFIVERAIRQPTNYFIASLAVSDLLIGSVSMPFYTVYLLAGQRWPLGEMLCDLWLSVDYTVCLCSIYTVLCITFDRFCSVKIPAWYRDWRTENKVLAMIAVTWAVPVVVFFTSIFGWQYFVGERTVPEGKCYVQYMEAALFNCLLQVGYFWITLMIMFALYTGIYQVVLKLSRKSEAKQKMLTTMVGVVGSAIQMRPVANDDDDDNNRPDVNTSRPTPGRSENSSTSDDEEDSPPVAAKQTRRPERLFPSSRVDAVDPDRRRSPPVPSGRGSNEGELKDQNTCSRFSNRERLKGGSGSMETLVRNGNDEGSESGLTASRVGVVNGEAGDSAPILSLSRTSIQLYDAIDSNETLATKEASKTQTPGQALSAGLVAASLDDDTAEWHSAGGKETLQVPGRVSMAASDCRESYKNSRSVGDSLASKRTLDDGKKDSIVVMSIGRCSYSLGTVNNSKWTHRQSVRLRGPTERLTASSRENRARKALRTITVILGAFVLCWTPWHILSMVISYCPNDRVCVNPLLYDVSYWLCYLNSPINPLCYALANQQFKKTFIRIMKFDFHRT